MNKWELPRNRLIENTEAVLFKFSSNFTHNVQILGSFSERVGNLFLSISQKDGGDKLFGSKVELETTWTKWQQDNDLNDADAITAFNHLLVFIKEIKPSFNIVEICTNTAPEGRNAALSAVIKEFKENNIYPLDFRKSQ